ncbi:hypothetical protein DIURU_002951 [Diutina rugosa]|uniref:Actin-related protein 2/3 complex subunit 5 n=1 Tax=Diutina rugosa TaxID=5481 RepID=A0A642UMR7_DIURU|nr:uncharacterized protein DIURU_002951 [Diutina rugosa]KAA8902157.1 hypothetical protein DIURU_002951 [Diutina rugosa]
MNNWRDIDIDALEGEYMTPEELVPNIPPVSAAQVSQSAQEAKQAMASGQWLQALQVVLSNPPYVTDSPQVKEQHAQTVFDVLVAVRNNSGPQDLGPKFIQQLTPDQQDTLIKYLYKNMSTPYGAKQGGVLLAWFEKTIEITGVGSIVRFMSDRRTV